MIFKEFKGISKFYTKFNAFSYNQLSNKLQNNYFVNLVFYFCKSSEFNCNSSVKYIRLSFNS